MSVFRFFISSITRRWNLVTDDTEKADPTQFFQYKVNKAATATAAAAHVRTFEEKKGI